MLTQRTFLPLVCCNPIKSTHGRAVSQPPGESKSVASALRARPHTSNMEGRLPSLPTKAPMVGRFPNRPQKQKSVNPMVNASYYYR